MTDLAIECRDFDLLFGKIQSTGVRSRYLSILSLKLDELEQITKLNSYRGIIDQFETINIDPSKACEMVAAGLVKKGLFEDAIKMFDLAGVSVGC